jgi:hypothetical protein
LIFDKGALTFVGEKELLQQEAGKTGYLHAKD